MSFSHARVTKSEPLSLDNARWVTLKHINYNDPQSRSRTWESAERLTRPATSDIDGVGIVAIFNQRPSNINTAVGHTSESDHTDVPYILLQRQYRPPIDKVVIEVPAGLVDDGESAEEAALRELKEETGYVGQLSGEKGWDVSMVMFNDPGFCNTNLRMIHVTIDLNNDTNQKPKPELDEGEFIECFAVPLSTLYGTCQKLEAEGFAIDARVATLAEGIELAKRFKLS